MLGSTSVSHPSSYRLKNRQHWQHQVDVRLELKIVKVDAGVVDG